MTVIGTVNLRSFDEGVTNKICDGEWMNISKDGEVRTVYVADIVGLKSKISFLNDKVPVFFSFPDAPFQEFIYPSFVVKRHSLTPAFDRAPWYGWVGRKPADDATEVIIDGVKGYDKYERQWRATPFDISYDVQYFARDRQDAQIMFLHQMKRMKPPWFGLKVVDSLGDIRKYDCGEMSSTDASDLASIDNRAISMITSFTCRGEIDLDDEEVVPAFLGATTLDKDDPLYSDIMDVIFTWSVRAA